MTVREPQDRTEGVYVTPEINSNIDNLEIFKQTLIKLKKLSEILVNAQRHQEDKEDLVPHIEDLCHKLEYSHDYARDELIVRQIGVVEVGEEQASVPLGLYLFLPVMSKEWIKEIIHGKEFKSEDKLEEKEEELQVLCWYSSYSGDIALHTFDYPFENKSRYVDLLKEFNGKELDTPRDIDALNFISHEILEYDFLLDFQPNSGCNWWDTYLEDSDIANRRDLDFDSQMSLFND